MTSPPTTPKYLIILMTERERGGAIIFCRILALPQCPPPQTPQYLTILMTERGAPLFFLGFSRSQCPTAPTPQYLTILMTEKGGTIIFCRILVPPPPLQTPQYLTILMTERGRHYFYVFWRPQCPPPRRHNT